VDGIIVHNSPETTPGGRALKHNASLRIQISKKGGKDANIYIEDENLDQKLIGRMARVNIKKNKLAKPYFESISVPVYYEPYFPDIEEVLFDVGRQLKLISVRKGIYKWDYDSREYKVDGRKGFIEQIKADGLQFKLANAIIAQSEETGVFLPPEIMQWYMQNTKANDVQQSEDKTKKTAGRRKGKDSEVGSNDVDGKEE
jgi:hypothetical protein